MMFILVKDEGRDIRLVPSLVRSELEQADIVLRIDSEGLTIVKNRVAFREVTNPYSLCSELICCELGRNYVQGCGHPLSAIVSSDEGTHHCRECEVSEMAFWKSGYTGIIHKFKEWAGFWALVECQRTSIPGRVVEELEGVLCSRCFPWVRVEK